jgi:hypothetical protein
MAMKHAKEQEMVGTDAFLIRWERLLHSDIRTVGPRRGILLWSRDGSK